MTIGPRWIRPEQAAAGVLDDVPPGEWPGQAAHWLAAGFDSEPLRQLGGAWGMTRRMDATDLLFTAAAGVSGTIEEVHEIEWPACAVHGGDPMTRDLHGEEPVDFIDGMVWWWCTRAGHAVAPVGQLTAKVARTL